MSRGDERVIINLSGIQPLDLRVLVLPDPVEEKTQGGIILPDQHKEREKYATMKATLIATGENAWEEAAARSLAFVKPVPGDRVLISKYGGVPIKGDDGKDYRIMNDQDVTAILIGESRGG
jgi:chaperonin GroES